MIFEEFSGTDRQNFSKYFWSAIRQKFFFRFFHVSDDSEQLSILPGKKIPKFFQVPVGPKFFEVPVQSLPCWMLSENRRQKKYPFD